MPLPVKWTVVFQEEFDVEFDALSIDVQERLVAAMKAVQNFGPLAARPSVANLVNPRHPNMKELRFNAHDGAEIWRAAFAFDPARRAVVLVAADKQGANQAQFYKRLLAKANRRFDLHLKSMGGTVERPPLASQRRSS